MAFAQSIKNLPYSRSFKLVGIYAFTNFLVKAVSFLLLPIFSDPRYLSQADNGLLSLFSQSIIFLVPFVSLAILQSASVDYFKLAKKEFRDFITTGIAMSATVTLLFTGLFWLFSDLLYQQFNFPLSFFWIIPLVTFSTFCFELMVLIIRNRQESIHYLKVYLAKIILELAPALLLIVMFAFAWKGRLMGIMISSAALSGYAFWFLGKNGYLKGRFRWSIVNNEIKYSLPIIAMQFSMFCLFSSDSFMLSSLTGNHSEVGIYGIACLFSSIIFTLCTALLQFMIPKINALLAEKTIDHKAIKKHFGFYALAMSGGLVVLVCIIPLAYRFFIDESYFAGLGYYTYLCCGYFFWSITYFLFIFLLFHKEKNRLLIISAFAIIVSLLSNYFFIGYAGTKGAAVSVCCSYFAVLLFTILVTQKFWKPLLKSSK